MFQFSTTTVVNSLKDSSGKNLLVPGDNKLTILRHLTFEKDLVTGIFKTEYKEAKAPEVTIHLKAADDSKNVFIKDGDKLRLYIYIGLTEGSKNSLYSNDFYHKGKPVSVDFTYTGQKWFIDVAKAIKRLELNRYGEILYTVEANEEDETLDIKGVNGYQIFKEVRVEKLDPTANHGMGEYTPLPSAAVTITKTAGEEGFGTYEYIQNNLRMPTVANTRWHSTKEDEQPVKGALYNQYTIHYCVDRGVLGMHAVGQRVTSFTTHTFFVQKDLATQFEAGLAKIGTVETVTPKRA